MARQRSPERSKAFEIWKSSGGTKKLKDIAAELGVLDTQIRKWKNQDKWDQKLKGTLPKSKGNVTKKAGAPRGNKNARGNQGGAAPVENKNAEKHGFFAKIFPDDPELHDIVNHVEEMKNPLDIVWENIIMQYTAIARAQKLMYVKNQEDIKKHLKKKKEGDTFTEKEWEFQYPWDRHANFLQAQARAVQGLLTTIDRYQKMLPKSLEYQEQQLKVEKLRTEIDNLNKDKGSKDTEDWVGALKEIAARRKGSGEPDEH